MYYNTAMKTINVAVVGLGYWGPNLVRNFSSIAGVRVLYGCDIEKKRLDDIKSSYPFIRTTRNYSDILDDPSVDLVAVATPVSAHFIMAKAALEAGKHVLVEKPMTRTSKQAKDLIVLAVRMKRYLFVEHTFVYAKAVAEIKNALLKKQLGAVYYYDSTRVNLGLLQQDVNVIWDLAPHDFAILNYLFDEQPVSLIAYGASYIQKKQIEVAHLILSYRNGFTAHIHVSWLSPVKVRTISLVGSKKMIVYNDIEPTEKIRIYDKGVDLVQSAVTPFVPAYRSGDILIPHLGNEEALYRELDHCVDCVKHHRAPLTGGDDGLRVVRLLEASDRSLQTNKKIDIS